jgi:DNA-binding IclR family transcriptional regulator
MKYKAPAAHQAIEIIELLISSGSLTLGQIAEQTGFSKATILRLLETMEAHCWVGKVSGGKAYEALVFIKSKNDFSEVSEQVIQNLIDELCVKTNHTVEWYQPGEKYAEIVLRSEPRNRAVNIRAKLGFRRIYAQEIEAVTRIAMASGLVDCLEHEPDAGYSTYKNGKYVHIALAEAFEMIKQIGNDLLTFDPEWNSQGIRRHAVGIKDKAGKLTGIITLASSFTPDADAEINELNQQLKNTANRLGKLFKQSNK